MIEGRRVARALQADEPARAADAPGGVDQARRRVDLSRGGDREAPSPGDQAVTVIMVPVSVAVYTRSARLAGPTATLPLVENFEPWHGQSSCCWLAL